MNATPCAQHTPGSDVWDLHCTVCGVRLFECGISLDQLVERVYAIQQEPIQATGRIRGTWAEVLEEGDGQLWAYWVRPARNFAGYEAIDTTDPEPTGEKLSGLLLAELAGLPAEEPAPVALPEIGTAWVRPKHKASRWERFKRWSRANAEREFVTIAAPLVGIWSVALFTVLGWDGVKGVVSAVASIFS
ncbi:hypothetical protein [Streptomyces sp. NPDC059709]|uniref:hypothetical protein n=1 Tax=Streptomyces sp. NPDC059709 TaxID=3346917 RepID=UPI0036786C7B